MELQFALEALDISSEEAKGLWTPVAAIFHLGSAGISTGMLQTKIAFTRCRNYLKTIKNVTVKNFLQDFVVKEMYLHPKN